MTEKNIKPDEPFLEYFQQVELLRSRGLIIDSNRLAIEMLQTRGYYNLINGYKDIFLKNNDLSIDEFNEGVSFTDLVYHSRVENDLRNILFKYTILFENRFKEAMSHTISKRIGVRSEQYLNYLKYKSHNDSRIKIINFLKKQLKSTKDNPTFYYRRNHNHIPAWIFLANTSLGQSRMWFSIFTPPMTRYVVNQMLPGNDDDYSDFGPLFMGSFESDDEWYRHRNRIQGNLNELYKNCLTIITDFRNDMAHGNRLIKHESSIPLNYVLLTQFISNKTLSKDEYNSGLGKRDLFSFLIALTLTLDKYDCAAFFSDLNHWASINSSDHRLKGQYHKYITSAGLPEDFVNRLKSVQIDKTWKQQNAEFEKYIDRE